MASNHMQKKRVLEGVEQNKDNPGVRAQRAPAGGASPPRRQHECQ